MDASFKRESAEEVLNSLQDVSSVLLQWFTNTKLKGSVSKCHLLISSGENVDVNIDTSEIKNTS